MPAICVYCGSRPGARPAYLEAARALGRSLVEAGCTLVYGGASVGLMGEVADAVLAAGGQAVGVIPEALVARELAHANLTELHVVPTMHARKALMAERSDAFVALPGGFGTFEELFEAVTWAQLGIHRKRVGLLDAEGFFGPLVALVDRAVAEGFVPPTHRDLIVVDAEADQLVHRLLNEPFPELGRKWAVQADL